MTDEQNTVKRSRGGRGLKATYPTTTVRVPEVLKEEIQDMVSKFYDSDNNVDNTTSLNAESKASKKLIEIENYIACFKDNNKVTKTKVKLYELIGVLENMIAAD